MPGRKYAVTSRAIAITGSQDLVEILPVANKPVTIHGFLFSNVGGTADAGDAQEELLGVSMLRNATATGSGGTTVTAGALSANDGAAGFTAKANNTTVAPGAAGAVSLFEWGVNIRAPEAFFFTPELMPMVGASNVFILRLQVAPADSVSCSVTVFAEESP